MDLGKRIRPLCMRQDGPGPVGGMIVMHCATSTAPFGHLQYLGLFSDVLGSDIRIALLL